MSTPRRRTGPTLSDVERRLAALGSRDWQHHHEIEMLSDALRAVDAGSRQVTAMLVSQLVALRQLLVDRGVLTGEEIAAAAQVAELERQLELPAVDGRPMQ